MKMDTNPFLDGKVILIDKDLEWSSFQVVNKIRYLIRNHYKLKKIKVGHAGTLDPLASGLLVLCTGKMTKKIADYQGQKKEYTGTITLGATTPSYDLETEVDQHFPIDHITEDLLENVAQKFVGEIEQYPPVFSALKKDGKRLYEYARAGEEVTIKARKIEISSFSITRIHLPEVDFTVRCSKGTYIRSLAHDFGKALGSGAHLSRLRRTAIGNLRVENAQSVADFEEFLKA